MSEYRVTWFEDEYVPTLCWKDFPNQELAEEYIMNEIPKIYLYAQDIQIHKFVKSFSRGYVFRD